MTKTSSLGTTVLLFAMTLLAGVFALTMLDNAGIAWPAASATVHQAADAVEWLRPDQVYVPSNLAIDAHAAKHSSEAVKLYEMLLQGQCVAVAKFCGGSEAERMYVCVDPVTGVIGAILQFGNEITTGYFERDGSGYWIKRVVRENWEVCQ